MPFELAAVRARFPALARPGPDGRPRVHADAPAGTHVLGDVIEAMAAHLGTSNANQHGVFPASRQTDALCERVRAQAAAFVGGQPDGVVFGANMTTLTWHFSHGLDERVGEADELVCTRLDHDANVAPWLALSERTGAQVRWVDLDPTTGRLDLASLDAAVNPRTALVAFPGASNVLGTVVDPAPFVAAARSVGALSFMDAVHLAPHQRLDQRAWGVDVLVCSPYKFFGPHAGLLSGDPDLLAELHPDKVRPAPDSGPERWQTGTASFEAIAGVGAALAYLDEVGMDAITEHEAGLTRRFLDGLARIPAVTLHGPAEPDARTPTFSLTVTGRTPLQVAEALAAQGIDTWAGHHYAVEPLHRLDLLDWGGTLRVGFVHYHGSDEVDRVLTALDDVA